MQFHQRLLRGLISSIASRSVGIVTQLVTVPVLARGWGVHVYGQNLTMIAMASYIPLACLGVGQSALGEMSVAHARGEMDRYSNALRGLFQLVAVITLATLAIHIGLAFLTPAQGLIRQTGAHPYSARWAIALIGLQAVLLQNFGVATNGLAALGRYGEAQLWDSVRLALDSGLLWIGVLLLGFMPDRAALVSAGVAGLFLGLTWWRLKRLEPDRTRLLARVDWPVFMRLWKSVMGNFALTNGFQMLLIQAPRLILAGLAGPAAVALFSIIWTLMGIIRQAFEVVIHPMTVEFAFAYGAEDRSRAVKMLALGTTAALGSTLLACGPVILMGPWAIALATKGQIAAPFLLVALLWAVLAVYSVSVCFQTAILASNQAFRTILPLTANGVAFLALAFGLTRWAGVYGMGLALLVYQAVFALIIVRSACHVFNLNPMVVVSQAVSPKAARQVMAFLSARRH